MNPILVRLKSYFEVDKKQSTLPREMLAGISTFFSLSYIFIVNPAILSHAGMDKSSVLFATIVTSGLATLLMGLWARLPFVLAPGMEMNAYVAFFVVGTLGFTWQQALGAVFWSAVVFIILTITRIREKIIDAIPERMKAGLSLCVGVFLGLVALRISGLLIYDQVTLKGLGSFFSYSALVLYGSLTIILILDRYKIHGAVLYSIVFTSILCYLTGVIEVKEQIAEIASQAFGGIGQLDVWVITNPKILSVILILFLLDFYGSIAKLIGLTRNTNIMVDGRLPRAKEALMVDGSATGLGAILGTTSITVYVESGVGIGVGGRTGLTAVVCSLLMFACLFISPLFNSVPLAATTGALVFVAIKLCPSFKEISSYSLLDILILLLMQAIVVATFAIDKAMLIGFVSYLIKDLINRQKPNGYLVGSILLLLVGCLLQLN